MYKPLQLWQRDPWPCHDLSAVPQRPTNGSTEGAMIAFLNFDGFLHPETLQGSTTLMSRLPLVEEVLRAYPGAELVISSPWRLRYPDAELAATTLRIRFAPDIAPRVVGVTPDHKTLDARDSPDRLSSFTRHWECEAWMRAHRPPGTRWMALDDRAYLFRPFCNNLMALDKYEAFTAAHQEPFRAYLAALTRGTPWPTC